MNEARRLLILRPTCFGEEPASREATPGTRVEPFATVKGWLLSGRILAHAFRYSEVRLATHNVAHISKAFPTALLLRVLSRGECVFSDDAEAVVRLGARALLDYALRFAWDLVRIPGLLASAWLRVARLADAVAAQPAVPADCTCPPLYLRSDLRFGLLSGGSVGHVAGVLNNLELFTARPVFVTTDRVPTVRPEIETHVVIPGSDFCGFEELPALHFNRTLALAARAALAGRTPAFVYQRYSPFSFAGLELADRLGVPLVLEYNGSEVWINRHWGRPLTYERLAARVESRLLTAARLVVVVSRPLRDELVERGVCPERILVAPNGVDPERYAPNLDGGPVRRLLGFDGCRVLGFIGTFGRWHGAEVLAEAFGVLLARRPELRESVRLLMVGDGLTRTAVEERLIARGVRGLAVLTGLVPQEEGPVHLAACDLLVSPHVRNPDGTPFFGSPTKVFEYMAMGRGIVASNLDQIGEVLEHERTALLVEPGDVTALVAALERLLADPALAARLGAAAREAALERHTWSAHTRLIVEALAPGS